MKLIKKPLTPRQQQSELKKDLIFEKAMALFRTYGYENTTITDICNASGVSTGSIYHFYDSKRDILIRFGKDIAAKSSQYLELEDVNFADPMESIYNFYKSQTKRYEECGPTLSKSLVDVYREVSYTHSGFQAMTTAGQILPPFIAEAHKRELIDDSISPISMAFFCHMMHSSIIADWTGSEGKTSLFETMDIIFPRLLKAFLPPQLCS